MRIGFCLFTRRWLFFGFFIFRKFAKETTDSSQVAVPNEIAKFSEKETAVASTSNEEVVEKNYFNTTPASTDVSLTEPLMHQHPYNRLVIKD